MGDALDDAMGRLEVQAIRHGLSFNPDLVEAAPDGNGGMVLALCDPIGGKPYADVTGKPLITATYRPERPTVPTLSPAPA